MRFLRTIETTTANLVKTSAARLAATKAARSILAQTLPRLLLALGEHLLTRPAAIQENLAGCLEACLCRGYRDLGRSFERPWQVSASAALLAAVLPILALGRIILVVTRTDFYGPVSHGSMCDCPPPLYRLKA